MDKVPKMSTGVFFAIGLGTMMTAFESSAVGAALPAMVHSFHGAIPTGKWIITGYLLALCLFLLPAGRLGDIFGYRRLYLAGLTITATAAIGCSLGNSLATIAAFRTVEGVGAALVLANGIPILTNATSPGSIGRQLGLLTTMAYAGLIMGSLMSGWLLQLPTGWRSVFIAALSLTLLSMALSILLLPRNQTPGPAKIQNRRPTIGPNRKKTAWHPNGSTAAVAMLLLSYIGLYCMTFILPFQLQDALHIGKEKTGLILAIRPILTAALTPVSGILADRYGARKLNLLGMSVLFLAYAIPLLSGQGASLPGCIFLLAGIGVGMGAFLSPNHKWIMQNAEPTRKGFASSTLSLTRNLGMLLGSALSIAHSALFLSASIIGLALVIGLIDQRKTAIKHLRPA